MPGLLWLRLLLLQVCLWARGLGWLLRRGRHGGHGRGSRRRSPPSSLLGGQWLLLLLLFLLLLLLLLLRGLWLGGKLWHRRSSQQMGKASNLRESGCKLQLSGRYLLLELADERKMSGGICSDSRKIGSSLVAASGQEAGPSCDRRNKTFVRFRHPGMASVGRRGRRSEDESRRDRN